MLEKSSTRKIFRRVRDDTSSLYVQNDSASLRSRWTGNLSNFSKAFVFDSELFVSKVYEKVIRSSLKPRSGSKLHEPLEIQRRQQPPMESSVESPVESALQLNEALEIQRRPQLRMESSVEEKKRSQLIDRQIEEDGKRIRRTANILLLGDGDCRQALVTQMKLLMNHFTADKRREYQAIVRNNLWDIMKAINHVIEKTNIEIDGITKVHARNLSLELTNKPDGDANISVMAAEAMQGLCASEQFVKLLDSTDVYIPDTAP